MAPTKKDGKKAAAPKAPAKAKSAVKPLTRKERAAVSSVIPQKPSVGRIVHFVLEEVNRDGEHECRPATIVRIPKAGETDPEVEAAGVVPDKVNTGTRADAAEKRAASVKRAGTGAANLVISCDGVNDESLSDQGGTVWKPGVQHDEGKAPGSWHWPEWV